MTRLRPAGRISALAFLLAAAVSPAGAEERALTLGFGGAITNDYEGADEVQALPLLSFEYVARKLTVRSSGFGLEADFLPSPQFEFGPTIGYRFRRDDDVEDDAVAALPAVDDALEIGVYAATGLPVRTLGLDDPAILTLRGSFAHDAIEGHGGFLIEAGVGVVRPLAPDLRGVLNVSASYASADYMTAYFGVTTAGAAASGLAPFDADAGLKDVGATVVLSYAFTDRWSASLIGSYRRLLGDAADSPLVDDAGTANQFFSGVAVSYRAY